MPDFKAQFKDAERKMGQLVSKAWQDPAFKARLEKDPAAVLKESGFDIPKGAKVDFHESSAKEMYLVIPAAPARHLSEEQLSETSEGNTSSTLGTAGSVSCPAGTAGTLNTAGTVS